MAKPDKLPSGALMPMACNWCHSMCEVVKVDFEWTIHQFELRSSEKTLKSTFSAQDGTANLTWQLCLSQDGFRIAHGSTTQSNKEIDFTGKCTNSFRVKIGFLNVRRQKSFLNEFLITEGKPMPALLGGAIPRATILDKANNLIVNGNLTVYCKIETYKDVKELTGETKTLFDQPFSNKEELVKDFEELFESKKHSDVTFNVGDQEFRAHKTILIARCPVFAAMFDHPTKEKILGVVEIQDINPEVFRELLRYIYTGQVPLKRMDEVVVGLLAAADKYLLDELKLACENFLSFRMSPENCIELLSLSKNNPAHYLREKAVNYVRQFPVQVKATAGWKKVVKETPAWIVSIMEMLLETQTSP